MQSDHEYLQIDYRFYQTVMDEQIWGSWRKKRSWNSSGRLQISPSSHISTNMR